MTGKDRGQLRKLAFPWQPDDGFFGRFSDSLIDYGEDLEAEFGAVSIEAFQPYRPVLIVIASTAQDGSQVRKPLNERMIRALVQYNVWPIVVTITPDAESLGAALAEQGADQPITGPAIPLDAVPDRTLDIPVLRRDADQVADIVGPIVEKTGARVYPVTGSETSGLVSAIFPTLARDITNQHIKQAWLYLVRVQRPDQAAGPLGTVEVRTDRRISRFKHARAPFAP